MILNSEFEMKDLGAAKKILGMEIQRDRQAGKLFLNQHNYIEKFYGDLIWRIVNWSILLSLHTLNYLLIF